MNSTPLKGVNNCLMKILRRSILEEFTSTNIYSNYSVGQLIEKIINRDEAKLTATGAIRATTGKYTGRSPEDKFIVKDALSADKVDWEMSISQLMRIPSISCLTK